MTLSITRFDKVAWSVMAAALLITVVIIWRGDQVGLGVVTMAPAPQTTGISPKSQLRIRFDQPLDAAKVGPNALVLTPSAAGTVRAEGDALVFVPATALNPDTEYTVEVAPGLQSLQGRLLHAAVSWHFQTGHSSVLFSQVDAKGKEQLVMAPVSLSASADVTQSVQLGAPRQITNSPAGIWDFAADANTGQVVYSLLTPEGNSDLWTLLPGAKEPSLLRSCPQAACTGAAFSPDSQILAYSQRNASDYSVAVMSPPRLYLLDLATGTAANVFSDTQKLGFDPRWSPDGKWLSYLSPDAGGVGAYNLENSTDRFYPTTTGETAVWHPQRDQFIMSEMLADSKDFEVHLFLIDPLTATRQDLSIADQAVEDNTPAFSPDGEWIAFRRKELEGPNATPGKQLWVMRADGSEAHALTQEPGFDHGPEMWSPDGRYLLYHRYPLRGSEIVISLWVTDVASGQSWQVESPGQRPLWVP